LIARYESSSYLRALISWAINIAIISSCSSLQSAGLSYADSALP
jgi:hypothetical protein